MVRCDQMHESGADARYAVMDRLQARKELLDSKFAKGIAALEFGNVQGHCGACGVGDLARMGR